MRKFIETDKLLAEIERRIKETESMKPSFDQFWAAQISAFKGVKTIITTLQQEQPEVDIAKEIEEYFKGWFVDEDLGLVKSDSWSCIVEDVKEVARHFYELGLNAKKEE